MSSRKRTRPSFDNSVSDDDDDDVDELSPSKSKVNQQSSAVKRRKLNAYGKSREDKKETGGMLSKIGGWMRLGRGEKENVEDELGDDGDKIESDSEVDKGEDIWEVPEDEGIVKGKRAQVGRRKGSITPKTQDRRKVGSAKAAKKDIWEVEVSSPEQNSTRKTNVKEKRDVDGDTPSSKSASKANKSFSEPVEKTTPKRSVGRPRKQIEALEVPSPRRSSGKPRKSEILKKAKALSREAVRKRMSEVQQDDEEEEIEEAQTPSRWMSGRAKNTEVEDSDNGNDESGPGPEAGTNGRKRGRPRKNPVESIKEAPKGILTPTKNRILKSKKSVAFETQDEIDLGFKDIPNPAAKTTAESKTGHQPSKKLLEKIEDTHRAARKKRNELSGETPELERELDSEVSDEEACAICGGLDTKRPNQILFCDGCDFPVHQLCYDVPKIPKGDWLCRVCRPDEVGEAPTLASNEDMAFGEISNNLPDIEGFEDHLQNMQRLLLDQLTGQKRIKLQGHDEEMQKVHQVVEQTVLAGEGNSMLIIGARGCGKTTLVESVISDLSADHRENFHVVRLNGFIHTDDKLALKEIWRQLGREMDAEDEMTVKANHADTLASLLALLSHPSEISQERAKETAKSVIFVLDEFDLFTTHPRQTLLYNLFDIAQARKAPIIVLGLTTRIDVVETLEKRVKSRFSHRYVHLSLPRSLPAFWEICKEGITVATERCGTEGLDVGISGHDEFISFWQSMVDDLYDNDAAFRHHLQSHFYRSKSVPEFFTSCILPIANLSARSLPLTGRKFTSNAAFLSAPDSKLHVLQGLSELELALLIAAARLDIILDTDTCNFAMAYDEYSSLTSRHKIQTSSTGVTALGASAKIWGRDVALGAWERLAAYNLLVPAGIGGGSSKDFGVGGRMWKVDVALEEITGSVESLSAVMAKWCREI